MSWVRLIRFLNDQDKEVFGEPEIDTASELLEKIEGNELYASEFAGSSPFELSGTPKRVHVKTLLAILTPANVPIIRCIGLNYMKHIAEGGRKPPPYPSLFIKPSTSIASFNEDIPIPKLAQENQLDYEGELAVVIGKTGKNISRENAINYIAGYAASNDVSARTWQRDPAYAGVVPQWCFSKGFDKFAPLGPMLVSPSLVGDGSNLGLQTFVNGELRQNSDTSDLLFGVYDIISFLSQGTTLEKGTVILTGTPSGVAMGMKPTPRYLENGDIIEVKIDGLGSCKNRMVFE